MMKRIFIPLLVVVLALSLVLITASPAAADASQTVLWGVTGVNFGSPGDYSEVFKVDTATGVVTIVAADTAGPLYSDIAVTPSGNVYTVGMDKDGEYGSTGNFYDLYRLDPVTGGIVQSWVNVFPVNGFQHVNALSAESDTSLLAIEGGGVYNPKLLRITLDSSGDFVSAASLGTIAASGAASVLSDGDLDRDPASGKWYAGFWASAGSEMIELNLANPGSSTLISQSNIQWQGGFAFLSSGAAYSGCWANRNLYTVDVLGGGSVIAYDLSGDLIGNIFGLSSVPPTEVWVAETGDDSNLGTEAEPFQTIQRGITAVAAGGVVNVADGEYAGAIVDKEVAIVGAVGGGSVITSGVHYGGGPTYYTGFRLDTGADGAEIKNFTVDCDDSSGFFFGVFSRGIDDVIVDSLTINGPVQGITNWGGSCWEITNNVLSYTEASGGGGIGIFVGATPTLYRVSSGNLIAYNTINATATAEDYSTPGIAISLDLRYGRYDLLDGTEDVSGNEVLNNTIIGNGGENSAGVEIGVIGVAGDPVKIAATMGLVDGTTVQGNVIEDVDLGLYFYVASNLTVTDNEMSGCGYGMYTSDGIEDAVIEDNTFSSNVVQVTDSSEDLDLELILAGNTFDRAVVVRGSGIKVPTIFSSIQDAIDAAESGDTIEVMAGTYVLAGQIVIDEDLVIVGEDRETTIIKPGAGFSGNYLFRAIDGEFSLSNVTLDGIGTQYGGVSIVNPGTGTIADSIIKNMVAGTYLGFGVVVYGDGVTVSNNILTNIGRVGIWVGADDALVTGNTYTGKGEVDSLDYGIEVGYGGKATITGNTITNCLAVASSDGSESAAILVTDFYGSGTEAAIEDNTLAGNTMGIAVGYLETDQSLVTAHYNSIFGNELYGVSNVGAVAVNATYNWWGHATGPYHETTNPDGEGDEVSDNVIFDPWLGPDDVNLTVSTQPASAVTKDSAAMNMIYTLGPYDEVEVQFVYKKAAGAEWSATGWVEKTTDGTHSAVLAGLDPETDYSFKAQLRYDDTVIEGDVKHFATLSLTLPTVTTQAATEIGTDTATVNMGYTMGDFSPVEVCFAYKKAADTAWIETAWVTKSASGSHSVKLSGLNVGTLYDFKAQLRYDTTVIEGAKLQFTTSAPLPPVSPCFIATAAYGTPSAEEINVLREFRDVVLMQSVAGSRFVEWYYRTSPPIADFIARHDFVRMLVRGFFVDPLVRLVDAAGGAWRN